MTALRCAALCLVLGFALPAFGQSSNEDPYLATLSITRADSSDKSPLGARVRFSMHVRNPENTALMLSKIDGLEVLEIGANAVDVAAAVRPTVAEAVAEQFLHNSFVIDFEEPSVQSLQESFRAMHSETPTIDDLQTFVHAHISDKTYMRSFDLASQVATSGAGDCTEHAVLLAALARAEGIPSRVIFGTVIVDNDGGLGAYGHAWTEVHDGSSWIIADATLPAALPGSEPVRYLPMGIFANEGPGYAMSMFEIVSSMPVKITGVANLQAY